MEEFSSPTYIRSFDVPGGTGFFRGIQEGMDLSNVSTFATFAKRAEGKDAL